LRLANGRPSWRRHAAGVALTLGIVASRVALNPVLGQQRDRHLFLLPAVMLSAWIGGIGTGAVSSVLCAIALSVFWTGPTFVAFPRAVTTDVVLFFLIGLAVSALVESLRVARSHAEAARAARDQLLAIVVHDLGNPLTAIKIAAGALRRTVSNDEAVVRSADRIDRAATRMTRLVRDLQDATQIERGELAVRAGTEPVAPILQEVADEYSVAAQAKGVRLETSTRDGTDAVLCDRARLAQVLANLVGNAIKFTPPGGAIVMRARLRDRGEEVVEFEVEDTGPGISRSDAPHVFERYWKGANGGTGLGLFIAQGIVRAHGGLLGLRSEPGRGATFFFTIPRVSPATAPGASREGPGAIEAHAAPTR
jgi:signal transduction histidine kinase